MSRVVRIIKGGVKEPSILPAAPAKTDAPRSVDISKTVKSWVKEAREKRAIKVSVPLWVQQARAGIRAVKTPGGGTALTTPIPESAG